eukprot:5930300-Pyramimonas_sp.AAC.1
MLAARGARAISSLAARHRWNLNLRSSHTRVSCESPRSVRRDVVASKRIHSEGVGWPTDALATRGADRLGAVHDPGPARI